MAEGGGQKLLEGSARCSYGRGIMLGRWILGLGVSLVLVGCTKPPAEYHYRLMLPGTDAPDHAD